MKIALPYDSFPGGFLEAIRKSFIKLGHEVYTVNQFRPSFYNRVLRKVSIDQIKNYGIKAKEELFNKSFLNSVLDYQPDVFINFSGGNLYPKTVKMIKENTKCLMICYVADNPCDPSPRRDSYFPTTLQYYDVFLNPEPVWDKLIRNLCEKPKIIRFYGGYDPEKFFPINSNKITKKDYEIYDCDVSFTGGSYYRSAEGAYRSGILGNLSDYRLKIWGDEGWKYRFEYFPNLKEAYQGNRLSYEMLRKLYSISKINLNMPSPQILTSFQPRVFEIAATKGFQIIDYGTELNKVFETNNIVTFTNSNDLLKKITLYKQKEELRNEIIESMYEIIKDKFTWETQIKNLINKL
jgi:Glycosyl transferases group 1